MAGAGCALAVLGVLVVSGDTGSGDGDFNQLPGIVLSALVVAAGFFVLANARNGAVATAGAVGASLGVPPLMFFLTFDQDGFPPYSTEGILIASTVVWLGAYLLGPARGRPFFLGAGLIALWFTVLELVEGVFTSPFTFLGGFFGAVAFEETSGFEDGFDDSGSFGGDPFSTPDLPDPATIGMLSLALGVAFLLIGRWLDRRGAHGTATPFAVAALPCLFVGVLGLAPDLEAAGSGLLMVLIGLGLAYHGATVGRRLTTWIGGGVMALGLAIFLGDMAGDDATVGGMLFIAGGIAMVFAGHAIAAAINEPDEMTVTVELVPAGAMRTVVAPPADPTPSVTPPVDETQQWAPPPPPDDEPPPPAPPLPPPPPPPA